MEMEIVIYIQGFLLFYINISLSYDHDRCTCYDGFMGADCSLRICPFGAAWSDQATATDVAHQSAECSNRGICDRSKGLMIIFLCLSRIHYLSVFREL